MYPRINTKRKENKNILSSQIYQHKMLITHATPLY